MATVNKNFKIKNGLVVEGTTATVNNFDILTKSSADQSYITTLVGGSGTSTNTPDTLVLRDSNGDFAAGVITATSFVGDLTGDVLGDVTGTVSDISNHDTDSLSEGVTNLYFTDARALSATSAAYDAAGSAATAESNANTYTDGEISTLEASLQTYADTAEADAITSANSYTDGEISTLEGSLQTYADDAEAAANSYTDSLIGDATVDGTAGNTVNDRIATAVANLVDGAPELLNTLDELALALGDNPDVITNLTTSIGTKVSKSGDTMTGALTLSGAPTADLHAATKKYVDDGDAATESAANSYTDGRETAITTAYQAYADQAEADANTYTDGQISTVNTTIGALDTDDVAEGTNQYFTDARAKTSAADLLTTATLTNIQITGSGSGLTITAENGVADSDTDDLAEGATNLYFTDARAQAAVATDISDAVAAGDGTATPTYLAVDVNSVALQVAATQSVATASQVVAYSWALADYGSAELVVKVGDGTNTEISKVLLTLDSSNNIAITEYGNVQTSGSLSAVSAGINGTDVEVLVTTVNNNSDVTVTGTLMV
jgi:hypothetical protein